MPDLSVSIQERAPPLRGAGLVVSLLQRITSRGGIQRNMIDMDNPIFESPHAYFLRWAFAMRFEDGYEVIFEAAV